jgi:hypothetical protein
VGDKTFYEGGHYNSATGRIKLNAYNIPYQDSPAVEDHGTRFHTPSIMRQKAVDAEFARYMEKVSRRMDRSTRIGTRAV